MRGNTAGTATLEPIPGCLVPSDRLGEGRFEVVRVLGFSARGGLYLVRDRFDLSVWIALEVIPPPGMPADEVAVRALRLRRRVEEMALLEHPHLARVRGFLQDGSRFYVLTEKVEGRNLAQETADRGGRLGRRQALRWALDTCRAMHFLEQRCRSPLPPFLEPDHVLIEGRRILKLTNFGLRQVFFHPLEAPSDTVAPAMHSLGQLLVFLLSGQLWESGQDQEFRRLTPELAWVVSRCLAAEPGRLYTSFSQVEEGLLPCLAPQAAREVLGGPVAPGKVAPPARRASKGGLWPRRALFGLLALVALVAVALGLARDRPAALRQGALVYVAAGQDLWLVRPDDLTLQGRIALGGEVAGLAVTPDGLRLYAAQPTLDRLLVIDTLSNQAVAVLPTEAAPERLVMDADGRRLYVLHRSTGIIEIVALSAVPLPSRTQDPLPHSPDRVVGMLSGGRPPLNLALGSPRSGRLYLSSLTDSRVALFTSNPPRLSAEATVPSPGPVVLSRDGRTLFVGQEDGVLRLDSDTLQPLPAPVASPPGQTAPVALLLSPDGSRLWSLDAGGGLRVWEASSGRLLTAMRLAGRCSQALFSQALGGTQLWLVTRDPDGLAVIDPSLSTVRASRPLQGAPVQAAVVPAPPPAVSGI